MSSYAISAIALFSVSDFFQEVSDRLAFHLHVSFCHNVTTFPAVLKKVNKNSFKNKMQQPHFIFYYYIYSIYINTYINILHVHPILKRGGKENPKKLMRTYEGGVEGPRLLTEGSVPFHLLFVSTLDTHAAFWVRRARRIPQLAQ